VSVSVISALGCLRLFTLKATNYQEHVTEYGVHWNFFFTVATISLLSSAVTPLLSPRHCVSVSVVLLIAYQCLLSLGGWTEYILFAPRDSFFAANREGLISNIGYFCLYLIGVQLGHHCMQIKSISMWWRTCVFLLLTSIVLFCLEVACDSFVQPVSRRLLNLSYVLWLCWYNFFVVGLLLLTQLCTGNMLMNSQVVVASRWITPINDHALLFFLLANLLTGFINLAVDTLSFKDWQAFIVLLLYLLISVNCVCLYHQRKARARLKKQEGE